MKIIEKIKDKSAGIAIIGLGYVGLPLGLEFAGKGFNVTGFDIDERKIPILNRGESYIKHIPADRIKKALGDKKFRATSDFSKLKKCDAIILCVPTPLNEHREPEMKYIENSGRLVARYLREGQLVVLESSTYPGTTEEILLPMFEERFKVQRSKSNVKKAKTPNSEPRTQNTRVGKDFYLAFSPEREDPNNPDFSTGTIPKVVGGVTGNCLKAAKALYDQVIVKTVPVSSTQAAEATKLLENIYRSINIALVNELKVVLDKMDIDVWEVIEAASTKPFGFHPFFPGPGLGGHCIPIDPFYLTWKAREYEVNTRFIELAGEINTSMPYFVVQKAGEALNKHKKSLNGSKILILGASYKKDIDDMRESPSLRLIELLREMGAKVEYNDPYVSKLPKTRKYDYDMKSVPLNANNLKKYDLILLSTDHTYYKEKSKFIIQNSKLVIDTRNLFGKAGVKSRKIFKA